MYDARSTQSEKKHARTLFDLALERELGEYLAEFKKRAANAKTAEDMWSIRDYLEKIGREVDQKYDYRYSQLLIVFGRLLRERRVTEDQLAFLSEEKLNYIKRVASL